MRFALAAVLVGCMSAFVQAAPVNYIFFDIGPTGQRVGAGTTAVGVVANNTNGTNLAATPFVSQTADMFSLSISNLNTSNVAVGGIDWRDRGDATTDTPLTRVGEDHIKNNGGIIRLTLSGLNAGTYTATSYHLDPSATQSNDIHAFIQDALNIAFTSVGKVGDADPTDGVGTMNDADVTNSSFANFMFTSNGIDPVVIIFDGTPGADDETPLNGLFLRFEAEAVPEPASIALWSLLGLGGVGMAWWQRRRVA